MNDRKPVEHFLPVEPIKNTGCFLCDRSVVPFYAWELSSLKFMNEMFKFCPTHKEKIESKLKTNREPGEEG